MTTTEALRELGAMLADARARECGYRLLGYGYKAQQAEVDMATLQFAIRAIEWRAKAERQALSTDAATPSVAHSAPE